MDDDTDLTDVGDDDSTGQAPLPPAKTFTQDELNRIIAKETMKVRREFGNYAQLKVDSDELRALKEATRSTEEKLRDEASRASRERDEARARAQDTMVRAEIVAEAAKQGAADPEDVARLLDRSELVITEDSVEGVREAVELLLAKKRYLVGGRRRAGVEFGRSERAGNGQLTRSQIHAWARGYDADGTPNGGMTSERIKQIEAARKAGTIDATR